MESLSQIENKIGKNVPSKMRFDSGEKDEVIGRKSFNVAKMIARGF
jgi:hypothetical protein